MNLKLTQFSKKPATRSTVCSRCGYRMFQTKRFKWLCGPGCDGAEQMHLADQALNTNSGQHGDFAGKS